MKLLKTVSSQLKLRFETSENEIDARIITSASCFRNEPFSFQILYRSEDKALWENLSVQVETDLPLQVYRVDQVPIQNTANLYRGKGYAGDTPGLYPNPLMPRPSVPELALMHDQGFYCIQGTEYYEKDIIYTLNGDVNFRSLWVSINPDSTDMQSGKHEIGIKLFSCHGAKLLEEEVFTLEVINCDLPENETYYTNWFHVDCLCDFYKVEPYSDEFYKYFESFVSNAARHRQNMLLIPAFTPPLDTVRGGERRNVQLVDVAVTENGYEFGFERLKKFLDTAVKCGIRYFEHCHLFSQWGAESAPNIYDVNGERIFGWDTPSNGDEYIGFLNAYLKELIAFAKKNGYVSTIFGRRRELPELSSSNFMVRAFGERVAMNTPIQGSAADIIKIAMVNIYRRLKKEGLSARLILQVHDELIIEAPLAERDHVSRLLGEEMENAAKLKVRLLADVHSGASWYDCK